MGFWMGGKTNSLENYMYHNNMWWDYNYDVSLRMGRAEHTKVTENKCRLRVVIFFYKHLVTPCQR